MKNLHNVIGESKTGPFFQWLVKKDVTLKIISLIISGPSVTIIEVLL